MAFVLSNESPAVIAEQINLRARAAKEAATPEEHATVEALVLKAKNIVNPADRIMERVLVTPPMAAIFWLDHNRFNRDWEPKVSAEYAAMMSADLWRITSQAVYALAKGTGNVLDGSHRLAAQVAANCPLDMYICLGMSQEDIAALDCGKKRQAADVCKLLGIANARNKQTLLKALWTYLDHADIGSDAVTDTNVHGVALKIQEHNSLLSRALELGDAVSEGAEDQLVADDIAAQIATVMLYCGWDADTVSDHLSAIQTEETLQANSPLWYARDKIREHAKPNDVWTAPKQRAVIIKAMMMEAEGLEITSSKQTARIRQLTGAAKHWPDPRRLGETDHAEAADDD